MLPFPILVFLGTGMGLLVFSLPSSRKRIAQKNIEVCFPNLSSDEQYALLRKNFISMGIAIMEVGLGGRLDAVNVFDPEVSIITSISLDHQEFLGNSIEKIFKEKNVVGFDIVELCPNQIDKSSDFLAAKLYYKMLTYKFLDEQIEENFDN